MISAFLLEDDENRIKQFRKRFLEHNISSVVCTDITSARVEIVKKPFDMWFLDHDLGQEQMVSVHEENTGSTFCRFVKEKNIPIPTVIVHSLNPIGGQNMINILGTGYRVSFCWSEKIFNSLKIRELH